MDLEIGADTPVEELVVRYPKAAGWLSKRGIRCVVCGEPYWGTLGELAAEDGVTGEAFETLIEELKGYLAQEGGDLFVVKDG